MFAFPSSFPCPCPSQSSQPRWWDCPKLLVSLGLCLSVEDSFILDLETNLHSFTATAWLKQFLGFFLPLQYLWFFFLNFGFPILSVLTIGINPLAILHLLLGIGAVYSVLTSMWLWTPRVEGLWCLYLWPFPSCGSQWPGASIVCLWVGRASGCGRSSSAVVKWGPETKTFMVLT